MKATQHSNAATHRTSVGRRAESWSQGSTYASAARGSEKCLPT